MLGTGKLAHYHLLFLVTLAHFHLLFLVTLAHFHLLFLVMLALFHLLFLVKLALFHLLFLVSVVSEWAQRQGASQLLMIKVFTVPEARQVGLDEAMLQSLLCPGAMHTSTQLSLHAPYQKPGIRVGWLHGDKGSVRVGQVDECKIAIGVVPNDGLVAIGRQPGGERCAPYSVSWADQIVR
jgi:hypothetical protein